MTAEQKATSFDMNSCMEIMKKMMSQGTQSCDCEAMMSQFVEQLEIPAEWHEKMSKMASCCGIDDEEKSAT